MFIFLGLYYTLISSLVDRRADPSLWLCFNANIFPMNTERGQFLTSAITLKELILELVF